MKVASLEGLLAFQRGHLFEAINHWKESMGLGNKSPQIRLALSSALSRVGNTQSALRHLRIMVSENPNLVTGHLALARLLAQSGNWAESSRHADAAKQLSPENHESSLLYLQAQMQIQAAGSAGENVQTFQDIEKQLSELEKAANHLPEFKLLKFQLALHQRNFTDAQALVTQLKKDYPSQVKTTMAEVELLDAQDKTDEAILILLKALEKFPQAVNQRKLGLLLAEFYVRGNQNDKVYSLLNTLAQKLPEDIPVKRKLLLCEQVINDRAKAQQLVDDIKSLEGEEGWLWRYEQAKKWFLSEDFEARYTQIISLLQKNLQANPNDQESRMLLAAAYERSGELQLAISTYREALSRSPNELRIIIPFIDVLSRSMEFDEVDRLLNRASAAKLDHPQLQQFQYQSYLRHYQFSSASDILQDFISHDPNNQANRFSLALLKTRQGKYDEAKELLDELKIQAPNSLTIVAAQVQLNIRQNKTTEALRLCDEIVNNLNNASAYIFRARTNASLKQTDKAIEDFEHAAAIEPNNVEVWMTKSEFYRSIGRPDKAIADIRNALSLASGDIRIQKQAISLFLESDDTNKVLQGKTILTEALKSNPDDVGLWLFKAYYLLKEETALATENAEQILRKITDDQPEISKAWVLLGKIALGKGQAGKAMETAFRGLSHTPNDKALLLLKARAEAVRSPILAIPTLKALLEVDPNNTHDTLLLAKIYTDATLLLANIYVAVGEPEKAVNLLQAQLISHAGTPDERKINVVLAMALHKNGNKADAQKIFDSLLQSEPGDPIPLLAQVKLLEDDQLWNELGQKASNWCQKHPEDSRTPVIIARSLVTTNDSQAKNVAENILRLILKNNSDSIEAMTSLAILLQTSGRSEESVPLYQRMLELQPDNLIVINNLAWIICEDKGKPQEALELAQRGLNISPDYIDLIDTRGVIYYQLGEFDKAVEDFNKCIELYPSGTPAAIGSHFHLAKAYAKLGQKDKAVEHLNQALEMNQALEPERRIGGSDLDDAQTLLKQLQEGN
jgi:tetratricopeptide (TPR) repeat protein